MIPTAILIVVATAFLTYANGANDNFKGVATLVGSGTTGFRRALAWATITTLAGGLTAVVLAAALVRTFSGKGLVPDAVAADPVFMAAIGLWAGLTVIIATVVGLPIFTTHALTGALVGAGWSRPAARWPGLDSEAPSSSRCCAARCWRWCL